MPLVSSNYLAFPLLLLLLCCTLSNGFSRFSPYKHTNTGTTKPTPATNTSSTTTTHTLTAILAGNDSYTTPTLKTLCTLDKHPIKKLVANDMLINIMI